MVMHDTFTLMPIQYLKYLHKISGEGKPAKLNASKIACTSKMQPLMAINSYGFIVNV